MIVKNQPFLISVVPLTRIPLTREQFFYYTHNEKIAFGTLVSVAIGKRSVRGIVIECKKDFSRVGGIQLKKITEIILSEMLTKKQYALAQFIATYYFAPLGITLKHFTLAHTKEIADKKDSSDQPPPLEDMAIPDVESQKIITAITKSQKKIHTIHDGSGQDRAQLIFPLIETLRKKEQEKQILVIVPEIMSAVHYEALCEKYLTSSTFAILHSQCTPRTIHVAWNHIRAGTVKVIIGTRSALFAPVHNVAAVIIDDAHDFSHKQWELTPRFDARVVAKKLAQLHGAHAITISAAPRVVDFYDAQNNSEITYHSYNSTVQQKRSTARYEIVDMKKERWKDRKDDTKVNYSPLSYRLQDIVKKTVARKKQSLLFVNHQGLNAFSVCTKCKTVMSCPKCTRALVEQNAGHFRCLHCSFQTTTFPQCQSCGTLAFRSIGIGTQQIEKEIKKILPQARVARVDGQTMRTRKDYRAFYDAWAAREIDIVIGTQMITKNIPSAHLECTAMIDTDALLSIPEYTTDEKVFAHIVHLHHRMNTVGTCIIQTFHPQRDLLHKAVANNYQEFYDEQIDEREILTLPPFTHVIKLICRDSDVARLHKIMREAYDELQSFAMKGIKITQPHPPLVSQVRGDHREQIILKIQKSSELPHALENFLESSDAQWIIDREPVSLL